MANGLNTQGNGRPLEGGLIGTRTRRYGGMERATGAQKYVADLDFPGVLAVAIVSIPVGCADILAVDTHAAEAMPGVVKVLTAADLPMRGPFRVASAARTSTGARPDPPDGPGARGWCRPATRLDE